MDAWIILSIAAAGFQTLRFMLQKTLSMGALSAMGATYARFAYAMPLAAVLAAAYLLWSGADFPASSVRFWLFALSGGLAQILATWCVVALFARRNFAVGITFKKTEVVQTALVGLIVLGDRIGAPGMGAIILGLAGVLILSDMPGGDGAPWRRRILNPAAGLGLLSGAFFAISAVGYRGATLEIASNDPLARALVTLAAVTAAQTCAMTVWLAWRDRGELVRVLAARRTAIWMGITGLGGSLCWFTAFTLQSAAYVFAVGQVEVIFSLAASVLFFGERISAREALGIALITLSVVIVAIVP
ncbi:DMT family transporter [Roseovarius spongiae]|uniref:DMT family transporter n=1 Tax=Roseovarius spongiae TaxID=2320272 RepID=A0A3A8BAU4_9RHOB|nr:DMT family transporter [Roseovarius spongiae]RKF16382.1 DMT family transporter [Roseovarius spongiae]